MKQLSPSSTQWQEHKRITQCKKLLGERCVRVEPWSRLLAGIEPHYPANGIAGGWGLGRRSQMIRRHRGTLSALTAMPAEAPRKMNPVPGRPPSPHHPLRGRSSPLPRRGRGAADSLREIHVNLGREPVPRVAMLLKFMHRLEYKGPAKQAIFLRDQSSPPSPRDSDALRHTGGRYANRGGALNTTKT